MSRTDLPRTSRLPSLGLALVLLGGCTAPVPSRRPSADRPAPRVPLAAVLAAVRKAPTIRTLPVDLTPSLATTATDLGFDNERCEAGPAAERVEPCVFGDRASATDVVLYGDSHAGMWLPAMIEIAERRHWRLQLVGKPACPAPRITFWHQQQGRRFVECDRFREFAIRRVAAVRPEMVVVTSTSFAQKRGRGVLITPAQWQAGLTRTLRALRRSAKHVVVLGDIPVPAENSPECLAANRSDITRCATTRAAATGRVWNDADAAAARATGAGHVPVLPWMCSAVCTAVVGNVTVYRNRFHLTGTYARMMNGVLEEALLEHFPQDAAP